MTGDAITEGAKAWDRLKSRSRKDWADWLSVGHALLLGRVEVMRVANTNKPAGSTYNRAMGHWLLEHGFDGINNQERYRAILVFENRAEIEAWRNGLDEAKRRRINHPNAAWALWRRAMRPVQSPAPTLRHHVNGHKPPLKGARAVHWGQDSIQRAAAAMRESRSTDWLVLARRALEAAIPDEIALLELLPSPKPFKSTPAEMALA